MCGLAIDIILDGYEPIQPEAARITLIIPRDGLEEASLWCADPT